MISPPPIFESLEVYPDEQTGGKWSKKIQQSPILLRDCKKNHSDFICFHWLVVR